MTKSREGSTCGHKFLTTLRRLNRNDDKQMDTIDTKQENAASHPVGPSIKHPICARCNRQRSPKLDRASGRASPPKQRQRGSRTVSPVQETVAGYGCPRSFPASHTRDSLTQPTAVHGKSWIWFGAIANSTAKGYGFTLDQINWFANVPHLSYLLFSWCVPILVRRLGLRYTVCHLQSPFVLPT